MCLGRMCTTGCTCANADRGAAAQSRSMERFDSSLTTPTSLPPPHNNNIKPHQGVVLFWDPVLGQHGPRTIVQCVDADQVLLLHGRDLAHQGNVGHIPAIHRQLVVGGGGGCVVQLLDGEGAQRLVLAVVRRALGGGGRRGGEVLGREWMSARLGQRAAAIHTEQAALPFQPHSRRSILPQTSTPSVRCHQRLRLGWRWMFGNGTRHSYSPCQQVHYLHPGIQI